MGKNRDRLSIVASILLSANSGTSKTHIMQKANLSFKLLEKYLDSVVSASLLRHEGSKYLLTDSGREFLKRYKDYEDHHAEAEKNLKNLASEHERLSRLCESPKVLASITAPIQ
jgi:predicted transcriptional regulator